MDKLIDVWPGDVVEVYFDSIAHSNPGPHQAKVIRVSKRYGLVRNGTISQNPLVEATFLSDGDEKFFDQCFVKKIIKRTIRNRPATNIFREEAKSYWRNSVETRGNLWTGFLIDLATLALSKLPYELDREIDFDKLTSLYSKQKAGCKSCEAYGGYICNFRMTVDAERFKKWVGKNYTRICFTMKDLVKKETREEMAIEADMYADMDEIDRHDYLDEPDDHRYDYDY